VPGSNVSNYHPPSVPTPAPKPASTFSNTNSNSNQIIGNTNNTKILVALKNSPWRAKADSLAVDYYTLINNGYRVKCTIGLMANLVAEGNYGIVEYASSKSHSFNFCLPSVGFKCKTIADIIYVRN